MRNASRTRTWPEPSSSVGPAILPRIRGVGAPTPPRTTRVRSGLYPEQLKSPVCGAFLHSGRRDSTSGPLFSQTTQTRTGVAVEWREVAWLQGFGATDHVAKPSGFGTFGPRAGRRTPFGVLYWCLSRRWQRMAGPVALGRGGRRLRRQRLSALGRANVL